MKKLITIVCLLSIFSTLFAHAGSASSIQITSGRMYENRLQPFSTDGCSRFPDGIPVIDPTKWQKCCIAHDIDYWQGGAAEQRKTADQNLANCLSDAGEKLIGSGMYLGVRIGGIAFLPTSWHWGYGWAVERGYSPLRAEEKKQVENLLHNVHENLAHLPIQGQPVVRNRESLTGNNCLDLAVIAIQNRLERSFQISDIEELNQENSSGFFKTLVIKTDGCRDPFSITFQLLRKNACEVKMNELLARGRIRMREILAPKNCVR